MHLLWAVVSGAAYTTGTSWLAVCPTAPLSGPYSDIGGRPATKGLGRLGKGLPSAR